jgi:hypothetical protein
MGLDRRNLIQHLQHNCVFGEYLKCDTCPTIYKIEDKEEHEKKCLNKVGECEYCHIKILNKYLTIHKYIGQQCLSFCENTEKCCYFPECKTVIPRNKLSNHLSNECDFHENICYACPEQHLILEKNLKSHYDYISDIDIKKILFNLSHRYAKVGNYVWYKGFYNKITKMENETITLFDSKTSEYQIIKYNEEVLINELIYSSTYKDSNINPKILECYKYYECTIKDIPKNKYGNQIFLRCKTCDSLNQNRWESLGCCLVCANECHFGHEFELYESSGDAFCDCGCNSLRNAETKSQICKAPKRIHLKDYENKEDDIVNLDFIIRGNGHIQIDIRFSLDNLNDRVLDFPQMTFMKKIFLR